MGALNLSLIIRAVDRATGPVRKIAVALGSLGNNRGLRALTGYARAGGRALGYAAQKARELARWGGAALGALVGGLGYSIFKTGAQYEDFLAVLEGTEHSATKAKSAMAFIQDFAKRTPYQLNEVTQAFVNLRSNGLQASERALTAYGDVASSRYGKTMVDTIEAVADAVMGEFERLKEFGVKAKVVGGQVELAYATATGRTAIRVKKDAASIEAALIGIFEQMAGGTMLRRSKGLTGILSNLGDVWQRFALMIGGGGVIDGENGVFGFVKRQLDGVYKMLDSPAGMAKASALAKNISDGMIQGIKTLKDIAGKVDFGKLIADIAALVGFGAKVIAFFGGFAGAVNALVSVGIAKLGFDIGALAVGIGAIFGIAAAPIAAVVAVVTALAIGAFLLWRNWDKVSAWVGNAVAGMAIAIVHAWRGTAAFFTGFWARVGETFKAGVASIWNALPGWMRTLLTGIGKGVAFTFKLLSGGYAYEAADRIAAARTPGPGPGRPTIPRLGPPRARAAGVGLPGFQRQSWDGKLTVELQGDQAARVRSVRSSSNDFDLLVDRGLNLGAA